MRIETPERFRLWLSKKYLDWAWPLWKFQGTFISTLQHIRERQLRDSEDVYKASRPPEGASISYPYLRLYETYHIEDFDWLWDTLKRHFPAIERDSFQGDISNRFRRNATSVFGGARTTIGIILRNRDDRRGFSIPVTVFPKLPAEVDRIVIGLHQILPSLVVQVFDIHLTDEATRGLDQLQNRRYLSSVRFNQLIPRNFILGGYSQGYPSSEMNRCIQVWLVQLRAQIEAALRPILKGHFMTRATDKWAHLPAIEVYALKGPPEGPENLKPWLKENHSWWSSFGLDFHFDVFANEKLLYVWHQPWSIYALADNLATHRLAVLSTPFIKSLPPGFAGETEEEKVIYGLKELLDAVLPGIVITDLFRDMRQQVEGLRLAVFKRMKAGPGARRRTKSYLELSRALHREALMLDRMKLEFTQEKEAIERELKRETANLKPFSYLDDADEEVTLDSQVLQEIMFMTDILSSHHGLAKRSFEEYLSARNIEVNYRLQSRMFWLTLVVTAATIVGLVASWDNIKKVVCEILRSISK